MTTQSDIPSATAATPRTPGCYFRGIAANLPSAIRRDSALIAIILIYWICGMIVAHSAGIPPVATITTYLGAYLPMTAAMVGMLVIARGVIIVCVDRPERPLTQLLKEIPALASSRRVAHALPIMMGMLLFGGTFTAIKTTIPIFAPFSWDPTFEQWDRLLHGGVAPWQWLQPALGWPFITKALDWLYNLWFLILSFMWAWQAFSQSNDRLRKQFFLSILLGWILIGNVAAMIFSSAGPCFFSGVTGLPDPYERLILYLKGIDSIEPVFAVTAQGILWHAYNFRAVTVGAGISAMPSMHVALATLFALVAWRVRPWLGIVMALYAMIVMVASVHLAWHYAVDGYVGAFGIVLIWWCVGQLLDRSRSAP